MVQTLTEDSPSDATVKKWLTKFKRGMVSTEYDRWSVCPKTSNTDDQVEAIHLMVLNERLFTVKQIAKSIVSGCPHCFNWVQGDEQDVYKMSLKNVEVKAEAVKAWHFQDTSDSIQEWPWEFRPQISNWKWNLGSSFQTLIKNWNPTVETLRFSAFKEIQADSLFWEGDGFNISYSEGALMIDHPETWKKNYWWTVLSIRTNTTGKNGEVETKRKLRAALYNPPVHSAQVAVAEGATVALNCYPPIPLTRHSTMWLLPVC